MIVPRFGARVVDTDAPAASDRQNGLDYIGETAGAVLALGWNKKEDPQCLNRTWGMSSDRLLTDEELRLRFASDPFDTLANFTCGACR